MACAVPGCGLETSDRSDFCLDHYFRLPKSHTALIFRMRFKAEQALTEEDRAYFDGQRQGYAAACVRMIEAEDQRRMRA